MEDRGQRDNLRGIPESADKEDLEMTVTSMFQELLDTKDPIKIDRVHSTIGPHSADPGRLRDVVCRLHHYVQKEAITKRAWSKGPLLQDGVEVRILPDLSRATLHQPALLRPLLDTLKAGGFTYRWGYPFHLLVRKGENTFILQSPADLPDLFAFLGIGPVAVLNWIVPPSPSTSSQP